MACSLTDGRSQPGWSGSEPDQMTEASYHDFDEPPVTEVALSFGFLDMPGLHVGLIGRFWESIRAEFPIVEHQPPYDMPAEPLEPMAAAPPMVELLDNVPVPRIWFKSLDGTKLIQLQQNWFAFNWQKSGGDAPYPRYPAVEEQFRNHAKRLVDFLEEQGLGDVAVTQCEVTYVNHIPLPGPGLSGIEHVLSSVTPGTGSFLPMPQQQRHGAIYIITKDDGTAVGRLHITANPGFRKSDSVPIIQLSLTARGYPLEQGENGIVEFIRLGRKWIVNGFVDVTTPEMHNEWGLHV